MDQSIGIKVERNYGIDLLRIVSMIMVLILHILGRGAVLDNYTTKGINNDIAWFLEIACYCAVNIFGIISGYVGYKSKHKYANILYLNIQITFLLLISITIFKVRYPSEVTIDDFKKASMPFAYYVIWYYRAYFCMFFFIPFMNMAIDKMTRNQGRLLIATIFIIFTFIPTFFNQDTYTTSYGYSALWLMMLYLTGAYFSKFGIEKNYKWWVLLLVYLGCVTLTFGWMKFPYELYFMKTLINYTSPTVYVCGITMVLMFAKMKLHKPTIFGVKFFAPLAFSVYVIHVSPYFWQKFMSYRFWKYGKLNPFAFPFAVIGTAILLFICFALIDAVRHYLFKLCRVKKFCNFIEKKIRCLCSKIFKEEKEETNELETTETQQIEEQKEQLNEASS